ncbi:flagellar hook-associated protein 3 [Maledivibacter halophilus]|uniref:Flagellar hook-associated protein 3 n=1 Tax=Maledivibacter halophilus TaxID=36842 RepID=A0A1T5JWW7_9FIRM|nr:flagellar hook-associated protein 3 [Maledivibacter halophilus]
MRVTNNMLIGNMMWNLNNNLRRLDKLQTQNATGKKIRFPSDDPIVASRVLKLKTDLAELEQYEKNNNDALSWLEITEAAVADIGDVLQRARELTVRAATGSLTTEDKEKISSEMEQLKKQLISSGNTTYAGRYVFSGYNTDTKLFDEDGKYNIDITSFKLENKPSSSYEISIGEDIQVSTNGLDIFGYEDIGFSLSKLPYSGSGVEEAKRANLSATSPVDLNFNFTTGLDPNAVQITVDGTVYKVDSAKLGALNGEAPNDPIDKNEILEILKDAEDGSGNKLRDGAAVYFDSSNNLQLESKSYGENAEIQVDFTGSAGISVADLEGAFGISDGTIVNGSEAYIESTGTLNDGDIVGSIFEGAEILVDLNGESKRITIGALPSDDVDGLVTAINTAFDAAYPPPNQSIVATKEGTGPDYTIRYTTKDTPLDGTKPNLKVDVVRAEESTLLEDFQDVIDAMNAGDEDKIDDFLEKADAHIDRVLSIRADIGARVNRMELVKSRIEDDNLSFTKLLTQNEDVDMAEVIMNLKNQENVYRASLSVGARVIQPTLLDFLR